MVASILTNILFIFIEQLWSFSKLLLIIIDLLLIFIACHFIGFGKGSRLRVWSQFTLLLDAKEINKKSMKIKEQIKNLDKIIYGNQLEKYEMQ